MTRAVPDETSESDDENKDRAKTYQVCVESRNDQSATNVERSMRGCRKSHRRGPVPSLPWRPRRLRAHNLNEGFFR